MSEKSRRASDRQLRTIVERYAAALRGADAAAAEAIVAHALALGLAPTTIQVHVITPAMQHIGELWDGGEVTVADEHLATALSTLALLPLQEPLQVAPPRSRERIVLAAVEGQTHVLGLQMVADVLAGAGFDVLYLGADVPTQALRAFVAEHAPAVTGLSSSQARDAPRLAAAIVAIRDVEPTCRIMLGGSGVPPQWRSAPYPWVADAAATLDAIEGVLRENTPQKLPAMIARRRARGPRKPRPAARAREHEHAGAELTDSGEVARRYARRAAEYRYLAYRDPLTALPNRRAFEDRMIALSRRAQGNNAVLAIDVDEFKAFNDSAGHNAGDELLRRVAQAIHHAVRAGDTVARIGGDEFTVLLPTCTQAEATRVAEQVRNAVRQASGGAVTVSIGAAPLGADRRGAVLDADRALYAAKSAGRNRTQVAGAS